MGKIMPPNKAKQVDSLDDDDDYDSDYDDEYDDD